MAAGAVKRFNPPTGHGFIQATGGDQDVRLAAVEPAGLSMIEIIRRTDPAVKLKVT